MAIDPRPNILPPEARQQTVVQSNDPVRELTLNMPLQSLSTSRVIAVVFSTISGGTRSHTTTSGIWRQLPLGGANGFTQMGNILVSAWVSRAGSLVYSGGQFRFAGLVGLAPEHATIVAVELTDMQNGTIALLSKTWDEVYENVIEAEAAASGYYARGVLAVGLAEGQHNFLTPTTGQRVLTQTSNSGFFSAPFSAIGAYTGQTSNDPLPVSLPFDGTASHNGILLFGATNEASSINSPEADFSTESLISSPGQTMTTDMYIRNGGDVAGTTDAVVEFPAMHAFASTDSALGGETVATFESASNIYSRASVSHLTDALLDFYFVIDEEVEVELVGVVTETGTTDTSIVNARDSSHTSGGAIGKDFFHLTDAYIFAGQSFHTTDALLQQDLGLDHTTDAALVSLVTSTHTTDGYTIPTAPPGETHTTDTNILKDNILAMTGFEMQDPSLETSVSSPNYTSAGTMTATALAKRPGSQGDYGMRIDNPGALLSPTYMVPNYALKSYRDNFLGFENSAPGALFNDLWVSFYFRCITAPTDWEMILSDVLKQQSYPPNTIADGFSYVMAVKAHDGGFRLTVVPVRDSLGLSGITNYLGYYTHNLNEWYKIEMRLSVPSGNLIDASPSNQMQVEVYLNGELLAPVGTPVFTYSCSASNIIGLQRRYTADDYEMDFDDFIISTNRLNAHDLSIIALPAAADGNYSAWTGTPADDYTDVSLIPYSLTSYQESSALGQRLSVKLYEGADPDPYPGDIHAASFIAVQSAASLDADITLSLFLREGATDYALGDFSRLSGANIVTGRSVLLVRSPFDDAPWRDSLYDMEFGVHQILNTDVNRVYTLAVNLLVSPTSEEHTTDAVLFGEGTNTHTTDASTGKLLDTTTDAYLDITTLKFLTTDAALNSLQTLTHSTDSGITGEVGLSHPTDTYIERIMDHATDVNIVGVRGSVHFTDTELIGAIDTYHDVDVSIWSMVDLPHDTDALQYYLIDLTYTGDSALLSQYDLTHSATSLKIGSPSVTHLADALKRQAIDATHTADGLKYLRVDLTHTTSAAKLRDASVTHAATSYLRETTVNSRFHSTISTLKTSFETDFDTDGYLKKTFSDTHTTSAAVFGEAQTQFTTNARIVIPTPVFLSHLATSSIDGEVDKTHTTTGLLRQLMEATTSTDAYLFYTGLQTQTTNALKYIQVTRTHNTSSHLYNQNLLTHDATALLYAHVFGTHTTDAVKFGSPTYTHTSTSILLGESLANHSLNGLLRQAFDTDHDVDAAIAFDVWATTSAAIGISAYQEQALASSLKGEASFTHDMDALKYLVSTGTHGADGSIISDMTGTHITTATKLGEVESTHATDTALATESTHATTSIISGETGSTHSTGSMLINNDLGIFEQDQDQSFESAF